VKEINVQALIERLNQEDSDED